MNLVYLSKLRRQHVPFRSMMGELVAWKPSWPWWPSSLEMLVQPFLDIVIVSTMQTVSEREVKSECEARSEHLYIPAHCGRARNHHFSHYSVFECAARFSIFWHFSFQVCFIAHKNFIFSRRYDCNKPTNGCKVNTKSQATDKCPVCRNFIRFQ